MSENINSCQLATNGITNNNLRQDFVTTTPQYTLVNNESFILTSQLPPLVTDVNVGGQNGVRNASMTMKTRENESVYDNSKYSFILSEKRISMSEDSHRPIRSQFYTLDISNKDQGNSYSSSNVQFSDKHSPDVDTISDTGTYIIEDEEIEVKIPSSSSSFKRYVNENPARHGTFDIHGLISSTANIIHRPVVDSTSSKKDFSLSSSNSSLLSFDESEGLSEVKSATLQPPKTLPLPGKKQIKPPEAFVISPGVETKSRGKVEAAWKSKLLTKDPNLENLLTPTNSVEKPSPSLKTSIRPHTIPTNQPSSFQRNASARQPTSEITSTHRHLSSTDEGASNLSKLNATKSFVLRQQRSTITPPTSKPSARQPLKSLSSIPTSTTNQTNRAVELRRARAQAKIEELSQRTKKAQLQKANPSIDIMSASWHSQTNKKPLTNPHPTVKTNIPSTQKKQDLLTTRTISSAVVKHHRTSSVSPIPFQPPREQRYQKMHTSAYYITEDRCDSLRDNGQRLAIKLIQLSSGILEKLKPNDEVSVEELEQLVNQLQTVNRTLTSIDASLTTSTPDDTFV